MLTTTETIRGQDGATLLTGHQAAAHADRARKLMTVGHPAADRLPTIKPAAIWQWVRRGHLEPAGIAEDGRHLYRLGDVARAEQATRARALRLVGIPMT